jgi:hypothetical protein
MKYVLIAIIVAATGYSATLANAAILPDGNGGALCKNTKRQPGSCTLLSIECKGEYTEYTDPQGTTYGKCTKVNRASQMLKSN